MVDNSLTRWHYFLEMFPDNCFEKIHVVYLYIASFLCSTIGAMNTSRRSRLQQLVDWCGGADFEGCLVFDECHKAKNFNPVSVFCVFYNNTPNAKLFLLKLICLAQICKR